MIISAIFLAFVQSLSLMIYRYMEDMSCVDETFYVL